MVGRQENAHPGNTGKYPEHLGPVVSDAENYERKKHHDNDRPVIDELGTEDRGVTVSENDKVVPFHIKECENQICGFSA